MVVCISGATGSFGSSLTRYLLVNTSHNLRLISRDEHKQIAMMREIPPSPRVTYILTDIRDYNRLRIAFHNADVVVHSAALKVVPAGEMHIAEMTKVNVTGTMNVIDAAIENGVPKSLFISSDKSTQAINSYGKTKGLAESLFIQANSMGVSYGSRFACVRGGNVWNSRGSVVEHWLKSDVIAVTDPNATRFHLPMDDWMRFCVQAIDEMRGGEIFVPKLQAWKLLDLAEAFLAVFPQKRYTNIGPRFGDRSYEFLISDYEASHTVDLGWGYCIEPSEELRQVWNYQGRERGKAVEHAVSSNTVKRMNKAELETLVRELR